MDVGDVLDSSRGDTITCHQVSELLYRLEEDAADEGIDFGFPAKGREINERYGNVELNGSTLGDHLEEGENFESLDQVRTYLGEEVPSLGYRE